MMLDKDNERVLPGHVPVRMPELPPTLRVHTAQQFKAFGDATRSRILNIIKFEPLTAKQIGERLGIPPGTIGHHLQVLDEAGLAQVVAQRLVHGIVAKYYTRTARLFNFDFPPEVAPEMVTTIDMMTEARAELADTLLADEKRGSQADRNVRFCKTGFPHARLSHERAEEFHKRLFDLIDEFATDPPDPAGQVYGCCAAFFLAPPYLQSPISSSSSAKEKTKTV